jgi:hypothetical protein
MMTFVLLFAAYAIILSAALARAGHHSQTAIPNKVGRYNPARLLVIGATGGTGRQLITQALERGYAVTAFVRSDPSRLQLDHPQLTVVRGDVLDEASLHAAMRGQEAVLCALGHKRFFYPTHILSEGTRNILRAMETHKVARLICETSLGIGDSAGRMGLFNVLFCELLGLLRKLVVGLLQLFLLRLELGCQLLRLLQQGFCLHCCLDAV